MSRCLLHVGKLEEFKAYIDIVGMEHRPGRGDYQVLQVYVSPHWLCVYTRHDMPEHYTVDRRLEPVVRGFCRQRNQS